MLYETGLAGDPLEYLNDEWINVHLRSNSRRQEDFNVDRYLDEWETRRTSPNGLFGIKLHYHQMRRIWRGREQEATRWFGELDQRVLLTRRDKIAQAVSLYRALTSQVWTSQDSKYSGDDNPSKNRGVEFNVVRIAELLTFLIKEEDAWRNYMKANNLPFVEFCYEDFIKDYTGESARLLKFLGINLDARKIPPPPLARQGQDNDPLILQFRQAIGFDSPD